VIFGVLDASVAINLCINCSFFTLFIKVMNEYRVARFYG